MGFEVDYVSTSGLLLGAIRPSIGDGVFLSHTGYQGLFQLNSWQRGTPLPGYNVVDPFVPDIGDNRSTLLCAFKIKNEDDLYLKSYLYYEADFGYAAYCWRLGKLTQHLDPNDTIITNVFSSDDFWNGHDHIYIEVFKVIDENQNLYMGISPWYISQGTIEDPRAVTQNMGICVNMSALKRDDYDPESSEFSPEYGPGSEEGGYTGGTFDDSSDVIGIPEAPSVGVSTAGFVNVYRVTQGQLANLGAEIFPPFDYDAPDIPEPQSELVDAIVIGINKLIDIAANIPNMMQSFMNSRLVDYIIDCHIIPVDPAHSTPAQAVHLGYRELNNVVAFPVTSDYVDVDCGSINIKEFYATFLDYAPFTTAKLFLPFVGFVDVLPEMWQSGTLQVKYRFNVIDGSFMCWVLGTSSKSKLTSTVIAQYGGNACVHVPVTGVNYANMVSGLVSGAASVTAMGMMGNTAGAISGAVQTATISPNVQSSNGYNSTTSFLSVRRPYLMIQRTVGSFSTAHDIERGLPLNVNMKLGDLSGFTVAEDLHLDGIQCTDAEKAEIQRALAAGVIL